MNIIANDSIESLIDSYRSGYTLEQGLYCDDRTVEKDRDWETMESFAIMLITILCLI